MIQQKTITVVLPAYSAGKTLEQTWQEIPFDIVDHVILVDDRSLDDTVLLARRLGIEEVVVHDRNRGYGGNQKTCYDRARALGSDIILMLHPDYQYTPKLIHSICYMISSGLYPVVFASRILGRGAIRGGMPRYKYFFNRVLTFFQNLLMHQKLSEYHTGYRAFSREVLETVRYDLNSDDFIFDNELAAQIFFAGFDIGEISCPTRYSDDSSSISFRRSVRYGFGVLRVSAAYFLAKHFKVRVKFLPFAMRRL